MMDAGIPVLTEIIPAPSAAEVAEEKLSIPAAPVASSIPNIPVIPVVPPAPASTPALEEEPDMLLDISAALASDEERWERLERDVRERVLHQVLERIDFVLEQRVRDSLADVLQTAVENLASDLRNGLHHSIRDVVTRAVSQEIVKLQNTPQ